MKFISTEKSVLLISAAVFAIGGAFTRFELQAVQTRFQLLGFWLAAVLAGYLFCRFARFRLGDWAFVLNGTAATIAILMTKFALEGLPRVVSKAMLGL